MSWPNLNLTPKQSTVLEIGAVIVVTLVAAWLRFDDLATSPPGLHGDEAVTGLEARRILDQGWIGVYSPLALGQPTGPLYLTALAVRLLGDTALAVRVVPALLGTVSTLVFYFVARRSVGRATAMVAITLLATLGWHIHLSRIGFPLAAWPLAVIATAGAAAAAMRRNSLGWWAIAAGTAAAGLYVYNAHPLFLAALLLGAIVHRMGAFHPNSRLIVTRASLARTAVVVTTFALVAMPMVRFAAREDSGYFNHAAAYDIFDRPVWTELSGPHQHAWYVVRGYTRTWDQLCCHPRLDGVDATGVTSIVPLALLLLALLGGAMAARSPRDPLLTVGLAVVALMPFAAVFTVDGMARRTFAMAPFLALFAAKGIVDGTRWSWRQHDWIRFASVAAIGLMAGAALLQSLYNELNVSRPSPLTAWVFAEEMTSASRYLAGLPPDRYIYFASDRWSIDYETRQFLAPKSAGEDRSVEFGVPTFDIDPDNGHPVIVLLGRYRDRFPEIERCYPGGTVTVGLTKSGKDAFIGYELAPGIASNDGQCDAGGPATPTAIRSGSR